MKSARGNKQYMICFYGSVFSRHRGAFQKRQQIPLHALGTGIGCGAARGQLGGEDAAGGEGGGRAAARAGETARAGPAADLEDGTGVASPGRG